MAFLQKSSAGFSAERVRVPKVQLQLNLDFTKPGFYEFLELANNLGFPPLQFPIGLMLSRFYEVPPLNEIIWVSRCIRSVKVQLYNCYSNDDKSSFRAFLNRFVGFQGWFV